MSLDFRGDPIRGGIGEPVLLLFVGPSCCASHVMLPSITDEDARERKRCDRRADGDKNKVGGMQARAPTRLGQRKCYAGPAHMRLLNGNNSNGPDSLAFSNQRSRSNQGKKKTRWV